MLNFHGIPKRNQTSLVQAETDGPYIAKRIVHVLPMTPVLCDPWKDGLRPFLHSPRFAKRTQVVKVAFSDGSTRMGVVTLQDHEVGLSATVIQD